jgi:hypothetical protein
MRSRNSEEMLCLHMRNRLLGAIKLTQRLYRYPQYLAKIQRRNKSYMNIRIPFQTTLVFSSRLNCTEHSRADAFLNNHVRYI